nr:hypothetical protein [Tanacetum cinerariifolium]
VTPKQALRDAAAQIAGYLFKDKRAFVRRKQRPSIGTASAETPANVFFDMPRSAAMSSMLTLLMPLRKNSAAARLKIRSLFSMVGIAKIQRKLLVSSKFPKFLHGPSIYLTCSPDAATSGLL